MKQPDNIREAGAKGLPVGNFLHSSHCPVKSPAKIPSDLECSVRRDINLNCHAIF